MQTIALPTLPEGLTWDRHEHESDGHVEVKYHLHRTYGSTGSAAPDPYTWLIATCGLDNPSVKSAVLSDWYAHDSPNLQRDVKVTLGDGTRLVAYETKPNPADPRKRLAALDTIHAQMDGQEWDADTLDVIAGILRDVGYAIREPGDGDVDADEPPAADVTEGPMSVVESAYDVSPPVVGSHYRDYSDAAEYGDESSGNGSPTMELTLSGDTADDWESRNPGKCVPCRGTGVTWADVDKTGSLPRTCYACNGTGT